MIKVAPFAALLCVLWLSRTSSAAPVQFTGTFDASNNSGVRGSVTLTENADQLTVVINASGLEANHNHPQHIHGFASGKHSQCATNSPIATIDLNNDGIIEDTEAEISAGPPIVSLVNDSTSGQVLGEDTSPADYPAVGADGMLNYSQTFTIDPSVYDPLTERIVELHGMTLDGTYEPTLPVACAELSASSAGAGNTGGGTAVPLPPGLWGGIVTISLAGSANVFRRIRKFLS